MREPMRFPDPERAVVDILDESDLFPYDTGIQVPNDWTADSDPFAQVAWDGIPVYQSGVVAWATVRVNVRAGDASAAKDTALLAQAVLTAHPGGHGVSAIRHLTGPLPSRDPDLHVPTCWFTVRAVMRAQLVT